jgi:hypothetical protein
MGHGAQVGRLGPDALQVHFLHGNQSWPHTFRLAGLCHHSYVEAWPNGRAQKGPPFIVHFTVRVLRTFAEPGFCGEAG